MSPVRIRRLLVAVVVFAAASVLPIRMAWSLPALRSDSSLVGADGRGAFAYPSSHVGVRWHGSDDDRLEMRWLGAPSGSWSAWRAVEQSHDLGDESAGVMMSGLMVVTDAVEAEVRVVSGAASSIEVIGIDTHNGPRHLVVARAASSPASAAGAVAAPAIVTRAQWGADESLRSSDGPLFATVNRLAVHHTAGDEGPDPAATVRAIYAYHTQYNHWNDIGYNYLVDSSGRVYEGRWAREYSPGEVHSGENLEGDGVIGAHITSNNAGTVGVALLGDFTGSRPTVAAVDGLERVLSWKAYVNQIDALGTTEWSTGVKSTIIGHRDAGQTACPGDLLYELLPQIRSDVSRTVGPVTPRPKPGPKPPPTRVAGYWIFARDAAVFSFGEAGYHGGAMEVPTPGMSMASTRTGNGYWLLSSNGRVSAYGDAVNYGSTESLRLNAPAVRLEPTRTGKGYWIQAADGGIFSYGDAAFFGSTGAMKLNSPVVSMSATPSGKGYWLLAGDGGVFSFGDAAFYGSTGAMKLNAPVVSMAPHPSGGGYWLQASDGGIFSFGNVKFFGSVPGLGLQGTAKTVQIRATATGEGYYVMGADGGIFTFGDAPFFGAQPGLRGNSSAVDLALQLK
jgi:hypothetical protein